jgi:GNAT superfamily N-acetyltransferase
MMRGVSPTLRPATGDDAEVLLAIMVEGFEGYRSFAPEGWAPEIADIERVRARIVAPDTWTLLAEDGGAVAGHVSFLPSVKSGHPDPEPDLVHLWQLFVRPPLWGTGLATGLMGRAFDAAREQGFARMRLFTPSLQRRARRFYEREGFGPVREFADARLGLDVAEYRRAL